MRRKGSTEPTNRQAPVWRFGSVRPEETPIVQSLAGPTTSVPASLAGRPGFGPHDLIQPNTEEAFA